VPGIGIFGEEHVSSGHVLDDHGRASQQDGRKKEDSDEPAAQYFGRHHTNSQSFNLIILYSAPFSVPETTLNPW
jgi:hypothetical protein